MLYFINRNSMLLMGLLALVLSCSKAPPVKHGVISTLSAASSEEFKTCEHKVPDEVCTRCNPELIPKFKEAGDWCPEHDMPESQCFRCHPDLTFAPLPNLPQGADLIEISHQGEDVTDLKAHAVKGKITLFDFYAVWCAPCRKIDTHVYGLMNERSDLALRKLNVVSWNTPVAKRYLKGVSGLPYMLVYDKSGELVSKVEGFDLEALDKAIAKAGSSS